ncbi:MAG: hypothetical protein PHT83_03080 [Bacilli bacterium]|nr:hypothetical protein [Bacilli bacterium]
MEEKVTGEIVKIKHYKEETGFGAVVIKIDFEKEATKVLKNMLFQIH